jgi:CubicO group peptidase (beta-lactamase class C family)
MLAAGLAFNAAAQSAYFNGNDAKMPAKDFDEQVRTIMQEVGVPGLSLAVIDQNRVVYAQTYGVKKAGETARINRNTVFEAASLTKSFLVLVAHKLVDEGKLDLDKPISQYLEYDPLKADPRYKLITPRMILSHSSGIENWPNDNDPDKYEIISEPGERYVYSGGGYEYLADVCKKILNKPYEQYVKEIVFEPVGVKRTFISFEPKRLLFFKSNTLRPTNYATGHDVLGKVRKKEKWTEVWPASGFHFTAEDYAKLVIATFNGRLLTKARLDELRKPIVRLDEDNPDSYYGPGYEVLHTGNDTIVSHGGFNLGFRSFMAYSLTSKRGVVFMTNSDVGNLIEQKMAGLAAGLDISVKYKGTYDAQYPSDAVALTRQYRESGAPAMFAAVEALVGRSDAQGKLNSLNQLVNNLVNTDMETATRLAERVTREYPEGPEAYYMLGLLFAADKKYDAAIKNLSKARELNYTRFPVEPVLKYCIESASPK